MTKPDDKHRNIALFYLCPAKLIRLEHTRPKILHANAFEAVQAIDDVGHFLAIGMKVSRGRTEEN